VDEQAFHLRSGLEQVAVGNDQVGSFAFFHTPELVRNSQNLGWVQSDRLQALFSRQTVRDSHSRFVRQITRVIGATGTNAEANARFVQLGSARIGSVVTIGWINRQSHERPNNHRHIAFFEFRSAFPGIDRAGQDDFQFQLIRELEGVKNLLPLVRLDDDRLLATGIGASDANRGLAAIAGFCLRALS